MSQITVLLPDGSKKELPLGSTGLDLAKNIGERLAQSSVGIKVNNELQDLNYTLNDADEVAIITKQNPESLEFLRHSTAHILAAAVQKLYPEAKIAIGPTIENGFYYDFYIPNKTLSPDDLPAIEKEMQRLIDAKLEFTKLKVENPEEQIKEFLKEGEKFKAELLEKYKDDSPTQYALYNGDEQPVWSDLCRGPHIPNSKFVKAFKLLSVSSAYWQANENNQSLQRVYGTAWWSKKELDEHLHNLEEAEKRDHRKLSKQHQLFSTHEEAGPGLIFWHPKLAFLRTRIEEFWKELHEENDYEIIYTPHIARSELWNISGHTEFYSENMYQMKPIDEQEYILKPMNCPFHVLIFNSTRRSYRELPVRYAEMGTVYRFERSGALHGLARVRGFTQDDAHVFCMPDQLVDEVCAIIDLVDATYSKFNLSYSAELSTRPDDRIGEDSVWDASENALIEALKAKGMSYELNEGDGAFYGPKIDFKLKDALGREWQGATIQLDFNLPKRFDLKFTNSQGEYEQPVMLHRAIFGSLERFTALLIEHYSGSFPLWLSQTQVSILPISDRHNDYCHELAKELKKHKIRVKVDERSEKVNAKIRDAQLDQIPYMLIVGDKEFENKQVAVRERRKGDIGVMDLSAFIDELKSNLG